MRFPGRVLVMILLAGALPSAHAVERDRGAPLPAWNIAAPDFAHDAGLPAENPAGRLVAQYRGAEGGVGLKRAPRTESVPAQRSEQAAAAAPASSGSTDWMLLLSGIVVAGYIARRRTRDVAD